MGDKTRGLYPEGKFVVLRKDGTGAPGGKHEGCQYFVLDLNHDPHVIPALAAYAESASRDGYLLLASDLVKTLMKCPAYEVWNDLKYKQLPPRLKRFLEDWARRDLDANRA